MIMRTKWFPKGPDSSAGIWWWFVLLQNTLELSYTEHPILMGGTYIAEGKMSQIPKQL